MRTTGESHNADDQHTWGSDQPPDMLEVLNSCMGYASTQGWQVMQKHVTKHLGGFKDIQSIELGCGLGKVSVLFSLLGSHVTLLDYSQRQLKSAESIHNFFHTNPEIINTNILNLPDEILGRYDVSMSFGTVEHFWANDRQTIIDNHARALKKGGLVFIWAPNRYGLIFHFGRAIRKLLGRETGRIKETPFTRQELFARASSAGITDIEITGATSPANDFCHFIIDFPKLLRRYKNMPPATIDAIVTKAKSPSPDASPWYNSLSYALLLTGKRA